MAIFQDQPINLQTIRGVSPERFVQRAERQQQAIVGDFLRMQQGIQAGIQEFEQKRAEKQNMQASLQLLKELGAVEGLSDESVKAGIKNAGGATNFLKTITDMETAAQQSSLLEAQIKAAGTPKTPAGKPVTGKVVTMKELNKLRDEGYKPTVKFGAEGEMIMTDLGTFAPQDTVTEPLTVGQEKMLEETAKDLAPWGTGGKQQAEANLATYDNLLTGLASGEITTRGFADLTPQALGVDDTLRQLLNPTGQDAVDNVRRVIFQGLKDTLGAQFTQREAERLVAASYNPSLPEEMNIARLQDAREVLADVITAKNDLYAHIAAGGTMGNYKGVAPAAVLSSGIKATQDKYDADPEKGGFQAPSGITIRVKSKRPTN
jgi:hypothetical protein